MLDKSRGALSDLFIVSAKLKLCKIQIITMNRLHKCLQVMHYVDIDNTIK